MSKKKEVYITQDDLEKAFDELETQGLFETEDLSKGEDEGDEPKGKTNAKVAEKKESEKEDSESEDEGDEGDDEGEEDEDEDEGEEKGETKKGDGCMKKGFSPDVQKAIEMSPILEEFSEVIVKSMTGTDRKLRAFGTIMKGFLQKLDDISGELDRLGSQPIRKSVTTENFKERKFGEEDLKKGEGDDKNVLSLSRDRNKIVNILDEMAFEKGDKPDALLAGEMLKVEQLGKLSESTRARIEKERGIKIVK